MRNAITVNAPAKLNLTLEVVERRPNGYHNIRSIMVRLRTLVDVLRIEVTSGRTEISIATNSPHIPAGHGNICHEAARSFLENAGESARIDLHIDKQIPVAAGLGGGSSDAAAVLLGLNRIFNQRLSPRQLAAIGADVGKDIPFFLSGSRAGSVSGMGESVEMIARLPRTYYLLVNPPIAVSTKDVYEALAPRLWFMAHETRKNATHAMLRAIRAKDIVRMANALYNDLEIVVQDVHPVINEIKQGLRALGAIGALMSGSGPTVFGLFRSRETCDTAAKTMRSHYPSFNVTTT